MRWRAPWRAPWRAALLASVVPGLVASPLSGQAVRGVVLDDARGAPVPAAVVRLVVEDRIVGQRTTDDEGRFLLGPVRPGNVQLEVASLGYRTARSQPFLVQLGDTVSVEFRVLPDAVLLRPLLVTATSNRGRSLFGRRQEEWGRGIFRGPEALDSMELRHAGDIFRDMEKVHLRWEYGQLGSGSWGVMPDVRTFLGRGCLLYMVNRVPVRPEPWARQDWGGYQLEGLRPEDVMAVEVYRYPGEIPPELRSWGNRSRTIMTENGIAREELDLCGLAVIWTKAGW